MQLLGLSGSVWISDQMSRYCQSCGRKVAQPTCAHRRNDENKTNGETIVLTKSIGTSICERRTKSSKVAWVGAMQPRVPLVTLRLEVPSSSSRL